MAMIKVPKGHKFIKREDKMSQLYLVVQGKVQQVSGNNTCILESGSLVGIADCGSIKYQCDYTAAEECMLYPFPYEKPQDFQKIFESQPKYATAFLQATLRQTADLLGRYGQMEKIAQKFYLTVMEFYRRYTLYCKGNELPEKPLRRMENMGIPGSDQKPGSWEIPFFKGMQELSQAELEQFYKNRHILVIGEIMHAARAMSAALDETDRMRMYLRSNQDILLRERGDDLFELYQELATLVAEKDGDFKPILEDVHKLKAYLKESGLYKRELLEQRFKVFDDCDFEAIRRKALEEKDMLAHQGSGGEGEDCLKYIMKYAGCEETEAEHMREILDKFSAIGDDYTQDDVSRKLRREITNIFYDVYKKVFQRSLEEKELSPIIQMFLYFGFLDAGTAGSENANILYDLTSRMSECRSEHVYTMYDWLLGIYEGKNEPSKNEFDLDYTGYLNEQKRMGRFTDAQIQEMKNDNWEKVVFELENMFVSASRVTYGKISTFTPVFSDNDVVGNLENMFVTAERIETALNDIRAIDFSIFYHEVIFSDPQHGVNKEMIQKEILPDVILMPNIGTRAMMWQETAGLKRDTSARFVFPIFTAVSLEDMMLTNCGRYRWEICRKIQGMRWNDITEPSLTSEYCDYVQFYRKNHDLSTDAKEKIKTALLRAKNNFREVFVMDYASWIKYEANGSFRLNRIARDIIFRYCPFNKRIRDSLCDNPMYQDIFQKYSIFNERKIRHAKTFTDKYVKSGGEITPELQDHLDFFDM